MPTKVLAKKRLKGCKMYSQEQQNLLKVNLKSLRKLFGTLSLILVQGFFGILPDFRGAEQLSLPLKPLIARGFRFLQQTLISRGGTNRRSDRSIRKSFSQLKTGRLEVAATQTKSTCVD
jgi:hypothetical protein